MKKIIVTESQFRKICENNGIYLDNTEQSSKESENIESTETTVGDTPVTTDKISNEKTPYRPYGWRSSGRAICENDDARVDYFSDQKRRAASTGTKMGQNIANNIGTTEGTNRKRKFDLNKKKNEMGKDAFEQQYGDIDTMVNSRLNQSRSMNSQEKYSNNKAKNNVEEVGLPNDKTLYLNIYPNIQKIFEK